MTGSIAAGLAADDALDLGLAHPGVLVELRDGDGAGRDCFSDELVASGLIGCGPLVALFRAPDSRFRARSEVICHGSECGTAKLPSATSTTDRFPLTTLPMGSIIGGIPSRAIPPAIEAEEHTVTSTHLPQIGDRVVGLDGHGVLRAGWVCGPVTVAGDPVAIPDLGVTFLTDVRPAEQGEH